MKVHAHSSLDLPLEYSQDQMSLMNQGSLWPFWSSWELYYGEILWAMLLNFRLILEGKTHKQMPKSSRLEFLEKFLTNNFVVSDAENNWIEEV